MIFEFLAVETASLKCTKSAFADYVMLAGCVICIGATSVAGYLK